MAHCYVAHCRLSYPWQNVVCRCTVHYSRSATSLFLCVAPHSHRFVAAQVLCPTHLHCLQLRVDLFRLPASDGIDPYPFSAFRTDSSSLIVSNLRDRICATSPSKLCIQFFAVGAVFSDVLRHFSHCCRSSVTEQQSESSELLKICFAPLLGIREFRTALTNSLSQLNSDSSSAPPCQPTCTKRERILK